MLVKSNPIQLYRKCVTLCEIIYLILVLYKNIVSAQGAKTCQQIITADNEKFLKVGTENVK